MVNFEYLLSNINSIKGIGLKTAKLFQKNINTIFDLLWHLPRDFTDRGNIVKINELKIGQAQITTVTVRKYIFPRVRNLPNKVICEDETGKLECVFFNSYEGYIRKILPLNTIVTISGKIGFYNNKYQITNPTQISTDENSIKKISLSYSLTDGITEKKYNKIISQVLEDLPDLNEWHSKEIMDKFDNISWKNSILELHKEKNINKKGNFINRLVFDEIMSNFIINSKIRTKIKKIKKIKKKFSTEGIKSITNKLNFRLTDDQIKAIDDINYDLQSNQKMFRLLQGDVGSGKTIVSLISSLNVIKSGFQVALMAPTEILARQHYDLAKSLFDKNINIKLLSSKTIYSERKIIIKNLINNNINFFNWHSLTISRKDKFQ